MRATGNLTKWTRRSVESTKIALWSISGASRSIKIALWWPGQHQDLCKGLDNVEQTTIFVDPAAPEALQSTIFVDPVGRQVHFVEFHVAPMWDYSEFVFFGIIKTMVSENWID